MANPIEQIRQGILEQDWRLVAAGYGTMTGSKIKVPKSEHKDDAARLRQTLSEIAQMSSDAVGLVLGHYEAAGTPQDDDFILTPIDTEEPEEEGEQDDSGEWEPEFVSAAEPEPEQDVEDIQAQFRTRKNVKALPNQEVTHAKGDDDDIDDDLAVHCRNLNAAIRGAQASTPRPGPQMVDAICDACKKPLTVPAALGPQHVDGERQPWKCDRCKNRHFRRVAQNRE